jgi:hypothetical protein
MRVPENLIYEKGHQGSNPGGHSFVFLNISINKKPFYLSQVVTYEKSTECSEFLYLVKILYN